MPHHVSDNELAGAVLASVQHGAYPDSEDVISAGLPSSAFPIALSHLQGAQKEVEDEARILSQEDAPEVDKWISQAKQLRRDIDKSNEDAHRILQLAEEERRTFAEFKDVESKANLLEAEVAFTDSLTDALELLQDTQSIVTGIQKSLSAGKALEAIEGLDQVDVALESLAQLENTNAVGFLKNKLIDLRASCQQALLKDWGESVCFGGNGSVLKFCQGPRELDLLSQALSKLGILDVETNKLYSVVLRGVVQPRLVPDSQGRFAPISMSGDEIRSEKQSTSSDNIEQAFDEVQDALHFLKAHLPSLLMEQLSRKLVPPITSSLITHQLSEKVPISLERADELDQLRVLAARYKEFVSSLGLSGAHELTDWIDNIPRIWLSKKRESTLLDVRAILNRGFGTPEHAERTETQTVTKDDDTFGANFDDWNDNWSDEEDQSQKPANGRASSPKHEADEDDAWGFDENESEDGEQTSKDKTSDDEGDEAWGWGDDANGGSAPTSPQKRKKGPATTPAVSKPKEREITLTEKFILTEIPRALKDLVVRTFDDYDALTNPSSRPSVVAPAAVGMTTLPTLMFAFYRASAPMHYSNKPNGNMYLYNDCLWLASQVRDLHDKSAVSGSLKKFKLEPEIKSLEIFGKRAYSKEMESQRTVLRDILDGTQGFANCSEQPFSSTYENAIEFTVDRLRQVNEQWTGILSDSALLQSVGSLVSSLINKIIIDVEDLTDISEPESQRLAQFCAKISEVESLFLPKHAVPGPAEEAPMPLTAVYTPGWLKFQYLASILESSLADIKYMWNEGELHLEFSPDEVVDLIEALFADSDYRRKAITEIRRSSRST